MRFYGVLTAVVLCLCFAPASAQEAAAQDPSSEPQSQLLDQAQLDQLVAPIALYPDALLSQILIASTYPLEVVQAERWVEKNKDLEGDALNDALAKEDWDDNIKSLVAVPEVLEMMNEDLEWTQKLGNAVLAQQSDVMDAIQGLRARAQDNGKLESNEQQTVNVTQQVTQSGEEKQVIVIEPTQPDTVYVPYYEPQVVYGSWPYPSYPPYYFEPRPGWVVVGAIATGLAWSAGFAIGNAIWGDGFDWGRNDIRVNVNRNFNSNVNVNRNNVNAQNWQHNSYHRRGVDYKNTEVKNKFGNVGDKRPGAGAPGDKRPGDGGLGDKRPGGGNLADKRPTVGDMEAALKKPGADDRKPDLAKPGGVGDRKPDLAAKRPDTKDMQAALKRKPDIGKKPDIKKPQLNKPQAKKPQIQKPQAKRASGNAFQKGDGRKARSASSRGKASVGNRSATKLSSRRPSGSARRSGGGGRRR